MDWIKVEYMLPEDCENVLWIHDLLLRKNYENIIDSPVCIVGYYVEDLNHVVLCDLDEYDSFFSIKEFTHWMSLPKFPT